ncbi:MAG: Ldh family oxidoreductase [Rikenellaceae bacterium]
MYSYSRLMDFCEKLFAEMGCSTDDAQIISKVLLEAELHGLSSHGMLRVRDIYELYKAGRINTKAQPRIVHESPSTATVDGDGGIGIVAAHFAMKVAIEKAKNAGTGWVAVKNSNHFGIAGYYAEMAVENDMVGVSMTNANPLVAPTFSVSRMLGTNPLAVAIPTGNQPTFVADFATTPIARGKLAIMGKQGKSVPHGYVQDAAGVPSTDPDIITRGGAIVPLGGDYEHGSHKGFCMGALIDIFSSVFSGANFGPFVPPQVAYLPLLDKSVGEGLGHFFGAMRIDAFRTAEEFKGSMDEWIETFRGAKPADGQDRVYIPGDIEREKKARILSDGIVLVEAVEKDLKEIGAEFSIEL